MKDLSPRTEIATLGEFGLIDRLTHGITPRHDTTVLGIGDDAASTWATRRPWSTFPTSMP